MSTAFWRSLLAGMIAVATAFCRPGTLRAGDAAAPNGGRLYREYCASCHGLTGAGDGPDAAIFVNRPRNLREGFLKQYETEDLVRRVREGRPRMPHYRTRLDNAQARTIIEYLKHLR